MTGGGQHSPRRFIRSVEGARGFAACYVVLFHLVIITEVTQLSRIVSYLLVPLTLGHEAVIVFFILSGFSIHYTHRDRDFRSFRDGLNYLGRRLLRLYPPLIIAVGLSVVFMWWGCNINSDVACEHLSSVTWIQLSGNLTFLADMSIHDGYIVATLPTNYPLWSLSYEWIYYLIYPLLLTVWRAGGVWAGFWFSSIVTLAAGAMHFAVAPSFLGNVLSLYIAWWLGAFAAELLVTGRQVRFSDLEFTLWLMATLTAWIVFRQSPMPFFVADAGFILATGALFCLPVRVPVQTRPLIVLILGCATLFSIWLCFHPEIVEYTHNPDVLLVKTFLLLFVLSVVKSVGATATCEKLSRWVCRIFMPFGFISYGLYVVHLPFLEFALYLDRTTVIPIEIGAVFMIPVILFFAWIIEGVFQPRLKSALLGAFPGKRRPTLEQG